MLDRLGVRTIKAFAVAAFALSNGVAVATPSHEWDIEGAYRWNPSTSRWIPLFDRAGFDEWNLTGVKGLAFTGGAITSDSRVFGRVYTATRGHGIIYGEPRASRGGPH
jgi:hypothetical protein